VINTVAKIINLLLLWYVCFVIRSAAATLRAMMRSPFARAALPNMPSLFCVRANISCASELLRLPSSSINWASRSFLLKRALIAVIPAPPASLLLSPLKPRKILTACCAKSSLISVTNCSLGTGAATVSDALSLAIGCVSGCVRITPGKGIISAVGCSVSSATGATSVVVAAFSATANTTRPQHNSDGRYLTIGK